MSDVEPKPGDVVLTEGGGEYRVIRPPRGEHVTSYDLHAGARVEKVLIGDVAEVVPRAVWDSNDLDAPDAGEPEPPAVPAYVVEGFRAQDSETLRRVAAYALELAEWFDRELDESEVVDDGEQLVDVESDSEKGTIVKKKIPCGKDCSGCPHGPYKYRAYRDGDSVKTEYLGPASG